MFQAPNQHGTCNPGYSLYMYLNTPYIQYETRNGCMAMVFVPLDNAQLVKVGDALLYCFWGQRAIT